MKIFEKNFEFLTMLIITNLHYSILLDLIFIFIKKNKFPYQFDLKIFEIYKNNFILLN